MQYAAQRMYKRSPTWLRPAPNIGNSESQALSFKIINSADRNPNQIVRFNPSSNIVEFLSDKVIFFKIFDKLPSNSARNNQTSLLCRNKVHRARPQVKKSMFPRFRRQKDSYELRKFKK